MTDKYIKFKPSPERPHKLGDKIHLTNNKWYEVVDNNYGVELTLLELRTYHSWSGLPQGIPEDRTKCIESVFPHGRGVVSQQCSFKRGHGKDGLYCKKHAKYYPKEG